MYDPPHWHAWKRDRWFESISAPAWVVDLLGLVAWLTLFFSVLVAALANG